jgi:hypothetical protein
MTNCTAESFAFAAFALQRDSAGTEIYQKTGVKVPDSKKIKACSFGDVYFLLDTN